MYLRFRTDQPDDHFSYILAKNPNGEPFRRDIGSASEGVRVVTGRFVGDHHTYEVVVRNDVAAVTQQLKEANLPSYVSAKPFAVMPYNLKGIAVCLKSAINGQNASAGAISDEEVRRPRKLSAHERRHEMIVAEVPADARRVVELGCGTGKLLVKLTERCPDAVVVGMEAVGWDAAKARRRAKKATVIEGNLTVPYLEANQIGPDVVVMSEVIEHLIREDRELIMQQLVRMWRPRKIIITAPNKAYNVTWSEDPEFKRHADHKIEHTPEEFESEVAEKLRLGGYLVRYLDMLPDAPVQPSFVLVAERQDPEVEDEKASRGRRHRVDPNRIDMRHMYRARDMYSPYHIEQTGYTVTPNEMRAGLVHAAFRNNRRDIVFLSPTMAPGDYDERHPEFLEHPEAVFDYFAKRDVHVLYEQQKMMGSRCTITVFRTPDTAYHFGASSAVLATSRSGFPFFDDGAVLAGIYAQVAPKMTTDVMVFDCEVLPWSYKAGTDHRGLITKSFRGPVEAALLYKRMVGDPTNVNAFLEALSWFASDGPLSIHPFEVLATANVAGPGKLKDIVLGAEVGIDNQTVTLQRMFEGDPLFKPVVTHSVNLNSGASRDASVARWLDYTRNHRGEGFVYKTAFPYRRPDGSPVQRALKVRGAEYLRLIYGFDYQQPEVFEKLKRRKTGAKRRLALQEGVLGDRILQAWLRGMPNAHERAVAAFLGMDGVTSANIDATL